ncbi:MAG: hypothetical protein MUC63_02720 [Planctomycetes bacterium]|nr:hypothetical protein [Planctomycetota bacterium]
MRSRTFASALLGTALALCPAAALAESGMEFAARLETLAKAERDLKAKDREAFSKFASECLAKKVGPAALLALEVLEAVDPGNPEWGAQRAQARSLGEPPPGGRNWGSSGFQKLASPSAKAWRVLMTEAQKLPARRAASRFAGIVALLEPNASDAHGVLGDVKVRDRWLSRFDAEKAKAGAFFDPQWGYVTESDRKKLQEGKRPRGKEWITVEAEERTPRTWEDPVVFEDRDVRVIANVGWDAALAFWLECRSAMRRMDDLFGDFFAPPYEKRPIGVFLARNGSEMDRVRGGTGAATQGAPVTFLDPGRNTLYARADGGPADPPGGFTLRDHVARDLSHWFLRAASGERMAEQTSNAWALAGLEALADSRALAPGSSVEAFGCFKAYKEAAGRFPPLRELLRSDERPARGSPEWARAAALCHFLLHGDGAKYRLKLLGVVREVLLGNPSPDDLPNALRLTADEIERLLDPYMKDLPIDTPAGPGDEEEPGEGKREGE